MKLKAVAVTAIALAFLAGALAVAVTTDSSDVSAADYTDASGVEYMFGAEAGTVEVSGYSGTSLSVSIPGSVTVESVEYSVKTIQDYAFFMNGDITSVEIADGVTSVGSDAFKGCYSLVSVSMPGTITAVGDGAFSGCHALGSVSIPSGVTSLPADIFRGCASLSSITVPAGVTSVGANAFNGCIALTAIALPASVAEIGIGAFDGCTSMTSISVVPENPVFSSDGVSLYNKAATKLITVPKGVDSVTIAATATTIGANALSGCRATSVTIPSGVRTIDDGAFSDCKYLVSVTMPDTVTYVGNGAFSGCVAMKTVTFSSALKVIGDSAFNGCTSLTAVSMPASLSFLGNGAFYGCSALSSVTMPDMIKSMGANVFQKCTAIKSITVNGAAATDYTAIMSAFPYLANCTVTVNSAAAVDLSKAVKAGVTMMILSETTVNAVKGGLVMKSGGVAVDDPVPTGAYKLEAGEWNKQTVVVMFNSNGGKTVDAIFMGAPGTIAEPAAPERYGFYFGGWFKESDLTTAWNFAEDVAPEGVTTLYAKWMMLIPEDEMPVAVTGLVYNGSEQIGVYSSNMFTMSENMKTNAGNYVAIATLAEGFAWPDHTVGTKTVSWSIAKADYDMSGVTWSESMLTYNGSEQSVYLNGLPETVTATYAGNTAINAGDYTASATFDYDTVNYNEPAAVAPLSWKIQKADYDMSGVVWSNNVLTYNGSLQQVVLIGLPSSVTALYANNTATNAGDYTATVTFTYDEVNYNEPAAVAPLSWKIQKADYDMSGVKWQDVKSFVYDGSGKSVFLEGLPAGVTAEYTNNTATEIGSYTASAVFVYDSANYNEPVFESMTLDWTIEAQKTPNTGGTSKTTGEKDMEQFLTEVGVVFAAMIGVLIVAVIYVNTRR